MAGYFIRLAWKNLWRNRRRTLLTVSAIGLGVMALVFLHNYYDSFHEQLVQNVIRYHSGHLVVSEKKYHERFSPNLFLKRPEPILEWAAGKPEISQWSGRVRIQGLASSAAGSTNVMFVGIDPAREKELTQFSRDTKQGTFEETASAEGAKTIVIGKDLAEILSVEVGSKIVALTQGIDGSIGNELFRVRGIFETQSDMDKALVFVSLPAARTLAAVPENAFHEIAFTLKSETELPAVSAEAGRFSEAEVLGWQEVQKPVMAIIDLNKGVNRMLMLIILSVAAMGIANSILMSLFERTREFGVMMAIGTTKREVTAIVIGETVLLCLVGVAIGNLFGLATTELFHQIGFDLRWFTQNGYTVQGMIVQTVSYPVSRLSNSVIVTALIFAVSILVSFFPARHIAHLSAVQALKAH